MTDWGSKIRKNPDTCSALLWILSLIRAFPVPCIPCLLSHLFVSANFVSAPLRTENVVFGAYTCGGCAIFWMGNLMRWENDCTDKSVCTQ